MMAASKKIVEQEPSEIESLLPWHAAGTLNARDARKVDEALARDPDLARQYAVIREEYAGTIELNESLGAPSTRAMQKLFAAIDAEPARKPSTSISIATRISAFFASLSPRTLAWSASLAAVALLVQAGFIGTVLMNDQPARFDTASLSMNEQTNDQATITRDLSATPPARALVRFASDAHVGDITALLDKYQAVIVDGPKGGVFRLQFAKGSMSKDEFAGVLSRLQNEKAVSLAVATP
jgi:anti-sigma factor RsiW